MNWLFNFAFMARTCVEAVMEAPVRVVQYCEHLALKNPCVRARTHLLIDLEAPARLAQRRTDVGERAVHDLPPRHDR